MASRNFALNEIPHEATVGTVTLLFLPEVDGPTFAEAYDKLRDVQVKVNNSRGAKATSSKPGKSDEISKELLIELSHSMSEFVSRFLFDDEQRKVFSGMMVPDRVLAQLMEWVAELYGSGSGNDDATGQSSD